MLGVAALVLLFVLAGPSARAADGVIEINQARALAGGITAGDAADFPVTLSVSGSYVLTSDLTVADTSVSAINVTADDVVIDLGGFKIQGPVACTGLGSAVTCSPASTGSGIGAGGRSRLRIERGTVRGFGNYGVLTGTRALIRSLIVESNANNGLVVEEGSEVSDSIAYQNRGTGIYAYPDSILSSNISRSNSGSGIYGAAGSSAVGNTATDNGSNGIMMSWGCVVRDNTARSNEVDGIYTSTGAVVSDNAATGNGDDGIYASSGSIVSRNSAYGNGGTGLELGAQSGYRENVIFSNTGGTVAGSGVNLGDNLCNGVVCP